jgi:cellulose synthase operon protein C
VSHRSFGSFGSFSLLALALLVAPRGASAQELLPGEREALAARARGDHPGAVAAFLKQAASAAATPADAANAARIEAWATIAARLSQYQRRPGVLAQLDALRQSPAASADPLLADRLAVAALEVAASLPEGGAAARADELGFLREAWLLGPFANERGSGMAKALPPETGIDLDAELPGKVRPVRWRHLPARPCSPLLPFDAIVHPHEQTLVYVAATIAAERAGDVVLELGSTGSWVVFTNGKKVASRDVERPCELDQDQVVVPLAAGPNLLLLKLGHQEGREFTAAVRLRGRDGKQPAGVRWRGSREDLLAAASAAAASASAMPVDVTTTTPPDVPLAVPLGGRTTWPIDTTQGADALRLAWLWRARDADGDRDRRDERAALAATVALPDIADSWLVLAATKIRHGRAAADRDDSERRRALLQALAVAPGHFDAAIQLGNMLREGSNLWRQARELADTALATNADGASAVLLRARTLRDEGMPALADAELLRWAARSDQLEAGRQAATLLAEREPTQAAELRSRVLTVSNSANDQAAAASQWARIGRGDDARQLLRTAFAQDPFARNLHRLAADLAIAHDDARAAITVLEQWLVLAPDDADVMVQAARCWRSLAASEPTAKERQLELLRQALQVEPNRRDDERYAEYLAKELDSGAAEGAAFHLPWRVDAAPLVRADAGPPADAAAARDPLHWLLRQQIVRANANGTTNTYRHEIVRVLTADGARVLQNWQLPAYRGEQRARLIGCTVFRADGTVQKPALQGARVRLPDLRPGDVVAVEGRIDDLAPTFFGDYFGLVHTFASREGSPMRTDDLLVLAAPGREYRLQVTQGAPEPVRETLADGTATFRFVMHDLARDRPEVQRPLRRELQPTVRITTWRDWEQFAAWWWNLIKNQLEVTPAMQRTVRERCAGLADVDAKIAALYHFVTTDVRYEAWEFGVHGYKPYATSVIHERRHGDCKDKALLLCALLGEIGVRCHPVLIYADPLRSRDDLELPMVEHFNHCIAWLPPQDGRPGRFLDGTATWHPTDTLPDMDQGAKVLVVDRGKADLRDVAWTTPAANVQRDDYTITLATDGTARLQMTQRPLGNEAIGLRAQLATEPARLREVVERSLLRTFGKVTLGELTPVVAADPEQPVQLTTAATLPELGQRTATTWQLPSSWEDGGLMALTADHERQAPLLLGVPVGDRQMLRYVLPGGWRLGELPAAVALTAAFGTFTMQWRAEGDAVVVERELQLTAPRIAAAEYAAFRDFVAGVRAADNQLVLLHAEGGR